MLVSKACNRFLVVPQGCAGVEFYLTALIYALITLLCVTPTIAFESGILRRSFMQIFLAYLLTFYLGYLRRFFVLEVRRGTLMRSSLLRSGGEDFDPELAARG